MSGRVRIRLIFVLACLLFSSAPCVANGISQKDAGELASLYFQSQDAISDILSSTSSIEETGPEGLKTRTCMIFMAFDFSEVQDWLHLASRDALFASNITLAHDRRNASVLLTGDLETLDKAVSITRDEINRQQGACSSSALVSQKAQITLGILSNITSAVGSVEIKLTQ